MATVSLKLNESWLRSVMAEAAQEQGVFTIRSTDGGGCGLGFHLVVTGTVSANQVQIHVELQ